jgi:hypothetical protein
MSGRKSKLQINLSNIRRSLRKQAEHLARTHTCQKARGCGCFVDQSISILELSERHLFEVELASYAAGGAKDGGGYDHYDPAKFEKQMDNIATPSQITKSMREWSTGEELVTKGNPQP